VLAIVMFVSKSCVTVCAIAISLLIACEAAAQSNVARDARRQRQQATQVAAEQKTAEQAKIADDLARREAALQLERTQRQAILDTEKAAAEAAVAAEALRVARVNADAKAEADQLIALARLAAMKAVVEREAAVREAAIKRTASVSNTPIVTSVQKLPFGERLQTLHADTIIDLQNNLEWRQADNGRDINWIDAQQYCAAMGWSLPSQAQLLSVFDASGKSTNVCGHAACKTSPLFKLSSNYGLYWAREATKDEAWYVALDLGVRFARTKNSPEDMRALCVRSPGKR
jgi:hypothetical protein